MYRDDLECRGIPYSVIVPDGAKGPYPVLLQLHGGRRMDDHTSWQTHGHIENGAGAHTFLIVMPRGYSSPRSSPDERQAFEDFLVHDLRAAVTHDLPARDGSWAIGGPSFGGYAALWLACRHPGLFASAWAHSIVYRAAAEPAERSGLHRLLRDNVPEMRAHGVRIGLDCGTEDAGALRQSRELHQLLEQLQLPHRYLEHPGQHDWAYWRERVGDAVEQHADVLYPGDPIDRSPGRPAPLAE